MKTVNEAVDNKVLSWALRTVKNFLVLGKFHESNTTSQHLQSSAFFPKVSSAANTWALA